MSSITAPRRAGSLTAVGIIGPLLVSCFVGCRGGWWPVPGPLNQQQASAVIHDPYPQNDIAPFEAASRPPGYQQPLPEPVRNRTYNDLMPHSGY